MIRKIIIIFFSLFYFIQSPVFSYSSNPKEFVKELVDDAINQLSDKNLTKEEKSKFIEKVAIENVDINALGLYTLGELRKSSEKEDILNYQKSFEKYFLKSFSSRLAEYTNPEIDVLNKEILSENYTIVNSILIGTSERPEVKIDWRIYTKNPDNPLIRDLIIEGLSLARTQKEEFASILNSNDGDINFLFKSLDEFSKN